MIFSKLWLTLKKPLFKLTTLALKKGLPIAFPINEDGKPSIPGNPEYRFESFGAIIGVPPKISFWVHYKSEIPEHVELGRFIVAIG